MDLVREHVSENGRLNLLANKQEKWPIRRSDVVNPRIGEHIIPVLGKLVGFLSIPDIITNLDTITICGNPLAWPLDLGGWVLRYRMRLGKVLCGIAEVEFCE